MHFKLFCFVFLLCLKSFHCTATDQGCQKTYYWTEANKVQSKPSEIKNKDFSYCYSYANTWTISYATGQDISTKDTAALTMYTTLYNKWLTQYEKNKEEPAQPSNHCLAIARNVFCAYQYPKCQVTNGIVTDYPVVCKFLCDLFKQRCPEETTVYNQICANTQETNCSFGYRLNGISFLSLLLFILFMLSQL